MADLTPDIVGEVTAACRDAADQIVAALTRALDDQLVGVTIGEPATYNADEPPEGLDGPGLVVVLAVGATAAVAVLPESSRLLPEWYASPDDTGQSKLDTLAEELSTSLLPKSIAVERHQAFRVERLVDALARAELTTGAALVPLSLKCDEKLGQLSLVWPVAKPDELMPQPPAEEKFGEPAPAESATWSDAAQDEPQDESPGFENLPKHTRSLFKVRVPVAVNLATQKQTVEDIMELVPGSIIKFDKSCDELLELVVGDQPVAAGEVVKVGDKFGLQIRNMILPDERFIAIKTTLSSSS